MDSFDEIWEYTLEQLKPKTTEVAYKVWLAPLIFVEYKNDTVYLSTDSEFRINILNDKYYQMIKDVISEILGFPTEVKFVLQGSLQSQKEVKYEYTFENFITGPTNRFAHAAALNVANDPGKNHNPLLIYGHSGLGKTHLLLAIFNELERKFPDKKIIYTSGEHFQNELVYYINKHNTHEFHEKYRNCDVLLVDDIQFIARGDVVQEEFFNTFNALKNKGNQIVLSSDRPPNEMLLFEDRLRSRFSSGLLADLKPPLPETRMAILKRKCQDLNFSISDDVALYIAENIKKNVRQIEGVVNKLKAFHDIEGIKPSISAAKKAISDIVCDTTQNKLTVPQILNEVSRTMNVSVEDICSEKRVANISQARHIAIYVCHKTTDLNYKQIGDEIGHKHHSSIIYSLREIEKKFEKNPKLKATVDDIINNLKED